jgi:phosphoglycerate dehydrogenase-like enzyme
MSWKVLITAPGIQKTGENAIKLLREAGCEIVVACKSGSPGGQELTGLIEGMDAVIAGNDQYSAAVLQSPAAARLRIISRWGVGYDGVDVSAATQLGIVIAYTPGLSDESVADYAFALLLALARRVADGHVSMREGLWLPQWGHDLGGKTLGILGFGRIGHAVARRAQGFNLRVIAHDPSPPKTGETQPAVQFVSFDDLLAQSDFLSVHAALTPESRGLIGEAQLRCMKPSAFLINAARGPLLDEPALLRALTEGWIAGAALDVFSAEPLPGSHPFRSAPNLLLSPHQASCGLESGERVSDTAARAIHDLMNGRKPQLVVNPEVFKSPNLRAKVRG